MLRNRFLILLTASLLATCAAMADNLGYVDCRNHPEETQVFPKPRRTPDQVASLSCGDTFTILQNGFIFSRIQTLDGKVGYVYSNVITPGRGPVTAARPAAVPTPVPTPNVPAAPVNPVQPNPDVNTQPVPTPVQAAPVQVPSASTAAPAAAKSPRPEVEMPTAAPSPAAPVNKAAANASSSPASRTPAPDTTPIQTSAAAPTASQPVAAPAPASAPITPSQPEAASTQSQPKSELLPAPITTAPVGTAEAPTPSAQPEPQPAAQPEPEPPAQPVAPAIRAANSRESWEKPNPGYRRFPLIDLFGGYGIARLNDGTGVYNNVNGAMGSFGWNITSWLQLTGDSSYNMINLSGTKNTLYGNHYGPRFFYRGHNRWGITPFVEGLVGGTRLDTSYNGTKTSANCISYKAGGGVDIRAFRHFEIRLFDINYYRTSFGSGTFQNNYWASAGLVIRLFGGGAE
jgi:hypothetical protein